MSVLRKTWPRARRSPVIVPSATLEIDKSGEDKRNSLNKQFNVSPTPTRQKDVLEWTFILTNFILELPSVVLDQLSSVSKPRYALYALLMSFAGMLMCIVEFFYKSQREKVAWKWRGKLPWFYYPSRRQMIPFGTFKDVIGLVCAVCQCLVTTINCAFINSKPIKISVWPIIFAIGLLCSKILENTGKKTVSFR